MGRQLSTGASAHDPTVAPRFAEIAIDNVDEAIALLTPDGPSLRIQYVNRGFEELLGYTKMEILGQSVSVLAGPGTNPDGLLRPTFDVAHPHRAEGILCTKHGDEVLVAIHMQSVEIDGAVCGLLVMRDVGEYRRLEQIAAASEMTESIGYICVGIRHELGNPVNSLKAALTLLADPTLDLPKARRDEYFVRALQQVARMESLLEQLRTFNLSEVVQSSPTDVRAFLDRFARLVREDCAVRGASIVLSPFDEVHVVTDARLLHQILLILLANALDAVEQTPTKLIRIGCAFRGRIAELTLADSGVGLPAHASARTFRTFVTTKPHGTGLGLPLAQRYAALLRCTLDLSSERGRGTTCKLAFDPLLSGG